MKDTISYLIAGNPNTPARVLEKLARDSDATVRRHVAENAACPESILERLCIDSNSEVRVTALSRSNYPRGRMDELLESNDLDALYMIAESYDSDDMTIHILVRHPNPYISRRALKTIAKKMGY